jgi:hypothetical protein
MNVGETGVFVGYRNSVDHEQGRFQLVQLQTLSDASIVSRRELFTFKSRTPFSRSTRVISSTPVPRGLRVNTLNVRISKGNLHQLSWNGEIVEFSKDVHPDASEDNDLTGVFGVYTNRSIAVFSDFYVEGEKQEFKP